MSYMSCHQAGVITWPCWPHVSTKWRSSSSNEPAEAHAVWMQLLCMWGCFVDTHTEAYHPLASAVVACLLQAFFVQVFPRDAIFCWVLLVTVCSAFLSCVSVRVADKALISNTTIIVMHTMEPMTAGLRDFSCKLWRTHVRPENTQGVVSPSQTSCVLKPSSHVVRTGVQQQ